MALKAPKAVRILAPEGTHIARLVRLLHIGTIPEEYMGEQKEMNKVDFSFELLEETHVFKDGEEAKPFVVSKEFTLSMGEKANLRKFIEGMTGKAMKQEEANEFDVESLLGKSCLIVIKHKTSKAGNAYTDISTASPLMKGQVAKEAFNTPKLLTFTSWDQAYFESLPEFIKEKVVSSKEYQAQFGKYDSLDEIKPEDVPFN